MKIKKIACMGDSLTEGYGIDLTYRWTNLLHKELGIDIINCGISGDTTAGMLARFQPMLLEHHPTHVIIMGGTNDLWHRIPDAFILSNILAMIRQARYHNAVPIVGIPTPSFEYGESPADSLFCTMDDLVNSIANFREKLIQLSVEDDFPIIDFGLKMPAEFFIEDRIHPNEAGQEVMKENALKVLKTIFTAPFIS